MTACVVNRHLWAVGECGQSQSFVSVIIWVCRMWVMASWVHLDMSSWLLFIHAHRVWIVKVTVASLSLVSFVGVGSFGYE